MAKAATKRALEAAAAGPDFEAAVAIINGRIATAKTNQSKASGEASQAWGSIEKMGINKAGAQMAAKVMNMEDEDERTDLLRSFSKILEAAGIGIPQDIVDLAQGVETPVVPRATRQPTSAETAKPGPEGDHDLAGEDAPDGDDQEGEPRKVGGMTVHTPKDSEPEPDRPQRSRRRPPSITEALESSRARLTIAGGKDHDAGTTAH